MLLSIITPIYKAERYIERCARSLMEQTMKEGIEFLFINDCTPDNSMFKLKQVLSEYPERTNQIRIIENDKNLGVSVTRKIGIKAASGEYVGWCDADDWCELDMFEKMYEATNGNNIDLVICNYWIEKDNERKKVGWINCITPQDCIINMWKGYYLPGSLWQQICRKSIVKHSLDLITEVNYSEDVYATIISCYNAKSISYVNEALYHYYLENVSSLVHNVKFSYHDWLAQKRNLETISEILYQNKGWIKYHVACNALKNSRKVMYKSAFKNILNYYLTFREAYRDVNEFFFTPQKERLKTFLVYNFFPFFWYKFRLTWNK